MSCKSGQRTHTHPNKTQPPARVSSSLFLLLSGGVLSLSPLLHLSQLCVFPPLLSTAEFFFLSPMSWQTHLSNTGGSSQHVSSSPVAKYEVRVYSARPWSSVQLLVVWCRSQLLSVRLLVLFRPFHWTMNWNSLWSSAPIIKSWSLQSLFFSFFTELPHLMSSVELTKTAKVVILRAKFVHAQ